MPIFGINTTRHNSAQTGGDMHAKLKGSELATKGDRVVTLCGSIERQINTTGNINEVTCVNCRGVIYENKAELHKWMIIHDSSKINFRSPNINN